MHYQIVQPQLRAAPMTSLLPGVLGFIGSHLPKARSHLGRRVIGLDKFAAGYQQNGFEPTRPVDKGLAEAAAYYVASVG